jgi:predicted permease
MDLLEVFFFLGGGVFWVKSEEINQQENKVLGLYDHIGNFVLTCLAP